MSVHYNKQPPIVRHSFCCRCEMPTENSPVGVGQVPTGPNGEMEQVKNVVLCLSCLELMHQKPQIFWQTGWPNQKG